jgi:glycosyltransferase involved in cell wall biosynthesis
VNESKTQTDRVVIILAAYNGDKYVREQIVSIQAQTYEQWQLIIRDDGSSDNTVSMIRQFCSHDHRIRLIRDAEHTRFGSSANFGQLMHHALDTGAKYIAFSDQDDVWKQDKLSSQLQAIKNIEARDGTNTPVLVYSDLEVVNKRLEHIHPSFMSYQGISTRKDISLQTLLVQNCVAGCTMLINRSLLKLAVPLPDSAHMHDWWVALCAASFGVMEFIPAATVLYRQHGENIAGAGGIRRLRQISRWRSTLKKMNRIFLRSFQQADSLRKRADRHGNDFINSGVNYDESVQIMDRWISLPNQALSARIRTALKEKIHSYNPVLTVLFYTQLVFLRRIARHD